MDERGRQSGIEALLEVMGRLRDPVGGCPWDRAQTFRTIAPYTIEEAYEVADAIRREDLDALRDELGDLLFQVVFHAEIARERSAFDFDAVARAITDKMLRRHPHVFGEAPKDPGEAVLAGAWESHKADERAAGTAGDGGRPSALAGVALALPALMRAEKLQRRAARVGFDWPEAADAMAKVDEEMAELRAALADGGDAEARAGEAGDLLFACVNVTRKLGVDAESALRRCNEKFEARFRHIERRLAEAGRRPEDATLAEMDALWDEAKSIAPGSGSGAAGR